MTIRRVFQLIWVVTTVFLTGCTHSPPPNTGGTPQAPAETPAPSTSPEAEKPATTPVQAPAATSGEVPPEIRKTEATSTPPKATPPAGPTGYISREKVSLQLKPEPDAPGTREFKIYEEVTILETKMTNEHGRQFDVPQWYKVRCSDGREGWVIAKGLSVN